MYFRFALFFVTLIASPWWTAVVATVTEETCALVNAWRAENGLAATPVSAAMTLVAEVHARNLDRYYVWSLDCNPHSWLADDDRIEPNYAWTSCCYANDHAQAMCMHTKGQELTQTWGNVRYQGRAFENAAFGGSFVAPQRAVDLWKSSPGHNALLLSDHMHACGAAAIGRYLLLWMGDAVDNAPFPGPTRPPAVLPTPQPMTMATKHPTPQPTLQPTPVPTPLPTAEPTPFPTPLPTAEPTPQSIEPTTSTASGTETTTTTTTTTSASVTNGTLSPVANTTIGGMPLTDRTPVSTTTLSATMGVPSDDDTDDVAPTVDEETSMWTKLLMAMAVVALICFMACTCFYVCGGSAYWLGFRPRKKPPPKPKLRHLRRRRQHVASEDGDSDDDRGDGGEDMSNNDESEDANSVPMRPREQVLVHVGDQNDHDASSGVVPDSDSIANGGGDDHAQVSEPVRERRRHGRHRRGVRGGNGGGGQARRVSETNATRKANVEASSPSSSSHDSGDSIIARCETVLLRLEAGQMR